RGEHCHQRAGDGRRIEAEDDLAQRGDRHVLGAVDPRGHGHARPGARPMHDRDRHLESARPKVDRHHAGDLGARIGDEGADRDRGSRHGPEGSPWSSGGGYGEVMGTFANGPLTWSGVPLLVMKRSRLPEMTSATPSMVTEPPVVW